MGSRPVYASTEAMASSGTVQGGGGYLEIYECRARRSVCDAHGMWLTCRQLTIEKKMRWRENEQSSPRRMLVSAKLKVSCVCGVYRDAVGASTDSWLCLARRLEGV
jgi:hypothetical protein